MSEGPSIDIPTTYTAVRVHQYGTSEDLKLETVAMPTPGNGQVIVKVAAASLNPRDWLLLRGLYPFKRLAGPFPRHLGSDFSGTVVKTGLGSSRFHVGDQVFGLQPARGLFGAFAEYFLVSEKALAVRPHSLTHSDVAGLPIAALTSLQAFRDQAKLKLGQHVLVNGASGGVGTYAIQLAKHMGATVTAVCGPSNGDLCRSLGADHVINYREDNFEDQIDSYDVVYDVIGRSSPAAAKRCMTKYGVYISTIPRPAVVAGILKSSIKNMFMLGRAQNAYIIVVRPDADDLAILAQMMVDGTLKTVVDSRYALKDIKDAFDRSQSWRARGKIIIDMEP